MGTVEVPAEADWGAQTQRSLEHFPIGHEQMPKELIRSLLLLKRACAVVNCAQGKLSEEKRDLIVQVCDDLLREEDMSSFPLSVYQTGSGTQTNMNVNEVIANRGNILAGKKLLHPNDDVNQSQSSNDIMPSALYAAGYTEIVSRLLPALNGLIQSFSNLEQENADVIKCGRTHLMDAVPLRFSQEISGWRAALEQDERQIAQSAVQLLQLAVGGTAVGTGLNAPRDFGTLVCKELERETGYPFVSRENRFAALTSRNELVYMHGALQGLACDLMKIANDIRWLASGPRTGLGEIEIPANEPGSSIMPGKVNPTQCEQVTMVAVKVCGNGTSITMAASQGNFELNAFLPVLVQCFLESVELLTDSMKCFDRFCVQGLRANREKMQANVDSSLMLVTVLSPVIGYEKAAQTAQYAYAHGLSLKEACLELGFLSVEEFEQAFDIRKML